MTYDPYNHMPDFDGETFDPDIDKARLTGQLKRVFDVMKDGHWRTLHHLSKLAKGPESSCSARLRDLRKPKFGEHLVERKRDTIQKGTYLYRLITPEVRQGSLF